MTTNLVLTIKPNDELDKTVRCIFAKFPSLKHLSLFPSQYWSPRSRELRKQDSMNKLTIIKLAVENLRDLTILEAEFTTSLNVTNLIDIKNSIRNSAKTGFTLKIIDVESATNINLTKETENKVSQVNFVKSESIGTSKKKNIFMLSLLKIAMSTKKDLLDRLPTKNSSFL